MSHSYESVSINYAKESKHDKTTALGRLESKHHVLHRRHEVTRIIAIIALILALLFAPWWTIALPVTISNQNDTISILDARINNLQLQNVQLVQSVLALQSGQINFTTVQTGTFTWNMMDEANDWPTPTALFDSVPGAYYTIQVALVGPFNYTVFSVYAPLRPLQYPSVPIGGGIGFVLSDFVANYSLSGFPAESPIVLSGYGYDSYPLSATDMAQIYVGATKDGNVVNCLDPFVKACIISPDTTNPPPPKPNALYNEVYFRTALDLSQRWISFDVLPIFEISFANQNATLRGPIEFFLLSV